MLVAFLGPHTDRSPSYTEIVRLRETSFKDFADDELHFWTDENRNLYFGGKFSPAPGEPPTGPEEDER